MANRDHQVDVDGDAVRECNMPRESDRPSRARCGHAILAMALMVVGACDGFINASFPDDETDTGDGGGGAGGSTAAAGDDGVGGDGEAGMGGLGLGATSAGGDGAAGSTADGGGGSGGSAGDGGQGGGGAPPVCEEGLDDCDGDWLRHCVAGQWSYDVDCTVSSDLCIEGRCELGLVLLLRFEEQSGTQALDESLSGYVGTITQGSWVASGAVEGALDLGATGHISLSNVMNTLTLPITMAAWVYVDPNPPNADMTILALDTSSTTNYAGAWLSLDGGTGNSLSAWFGNNTSVGSTGRNGKETSAGALASTWTHVAAVLRGHDDASLYVDGVDQGGSYSGSASTMAFTAAPALVGISHWAGYDLQYHGALDDVRIYNRALTGAEVAELATP